MKALFLTLIISLPVFANPELISKEAFNKLSSCEKKVVTEVIRVLKKDSLNADGNMVLGRPYLLWTEIAVSAISEQFDTYIFRKNFPEYFPWQVIFKAQPMDTRDPLYRRGRGDKFGFDVLTTIPKKTGFFSSDKDCELVNYKTDARLVHYFEVQSGRSSNSNPFVHFYSLTNF